MNSRGHAARRSDGTASVRRIAPPRALGEVNESVVVACEDMSAGQACGAAVAGPIRWPLCGRLFTISTLAECTGAARRKREKGPPPVIAGHGIHE